MSKNDRNDDNYLPRVRASGRGAYARGCLRLLLVVPRLRCVSPAKAGGLLRVLQLRSDAVPAEAAVRRLLDGTYHLEHIRHV